MKNLKLPLFVGLAALAVVLVVGAFTTNFTAYLDNDPTTCNNCHVMDAVYEGWFHGSHQAAAVCIDCHAPHALIPKYIYKGMAGMNHVAMFTIGHIPEPLRAKESSLQLVQENCIRCHSATVSMIADGEKDSGRYCFECHRTAGHGPRGISILPYQDTGMYTPPQYQVPEDN
jgi:cytochrome c nitrite reductase small subunit